MIDKYPKVEEIPTLFEVRANLHGEFREGGYRHN